MRGKTWFYIPLAYWTESVKQQTTDTNVPFKYTPWNRKMQMDLKWLFSHFLQRWYIASTNLEADNSLHMKNALGHQGLIPKELHLQRLVKKLPNTQVESANNGCHLWIKVYILSIFSDLTWLLNLLQESWIVNNK